MEKSDRRFLVGTAVGVFAKEFFGICTVSTT